MNYEEIAVTLVFLVLVMYGQPGVAMTTMPLPYHYDECKARGEDFVSVDRTRRRYFCIVAGDK